jgi:hypothetical protein
MTIALERPAPAPAIEVLEPEERRRNGSAALTLETITACKETVAVTGAVAPSLVHAELRVNGRLVPIDSDGTFCAIVVLLGKRGVTLTLESASGVCAVLELPLRTG